MYKKENHLIFKINQKKNLYYIYNSKPLIYRLAFYFYHIFILCFDQLKIYLHVTTTTTGTIFILKINFIYN